MKTSEDRNFEEEWKSALDGAEMAPSDHVWNSIDLKISHAEQGEMKKRVLFYQRVAAASILFALCLGAAGWFWNYEDASVKSLASQTVGENQKESASSIAKVPFSNQNSSNSSAVTITESQNANSIKSAVGNYENGVKTRIENGGKNHALASEASNGSDIAAMIAPADKNVLTLGKEAELESRRTSQSNTGFENGSVTELATNGLSMSAIRLTGKPVEQIESARTFKIAKKEQSPTDDQNRNWWASVNGSGGAYNQSSSSNSVATSLFQQSATSTFYAAPNSKEVGVGTSFSYGMSMGKKVANRWVVMGGVNYLNQSIDYQTNIVLQDASQSKAFLADLASLSSNLASTNPYVLRNTNEFISVPLQAGYLLLNRKAGVQLNAGVAADIFYRNTMTDLSGQFGSFSQAAGDNSVYRNLNWTGLLGTELSYKMNRHYQVSLMPGFRYSFNSVLKSSTGSTINPLVWDVGFRLKYVF
ncbi:MAG: hypothetical protein HYZ44_01260 [Bacteroidetes bacterium]|nr:hypothetical protein [Bacteroidota bacterium]